MRFVLLFLFCLIILHIGNADAIAFIKKKPAVTIPPIINQTISVIPVGNVTRADVVTDKDQLKKLQNELDSTKLDFKKYTDEVVNMETALNNAEHFFKSAKATHDNYPTEASRLKLVDAQAKLDTAKKNLSESEARKHTAFDRIKDLNRMITDLTKLIANKQTRIDQEKRSNGVQSIGILLSNTCVTMLENGFHTTCPTYADLMALNLDTSKKESGLFSFYDGYYHRNDPLYKNDDQLYNLKDYNIFIDPSQAFHGKIKTITIQPNFNNYLLPVDMKKENNTRIIHQDRYVDACTDATINADTWIKTVADTVQYLRGGCIGTLLNSVYNVTDSTISHDIGTSSKYKQAQWMKEAKEKYKTSHIGNDTSVNPSVITDEDKR